MKKLVCFVTVLLLCISLAVPAFATSTFVPSIPYKDVPEIEWPVELIDEEGEIIDEIDWEHLVVTPISEVETSTEIPEDSREELLEVYEDLTSGEMELPSDEDLVIRDLFDASWICDDGHEEELEKEGVCIEITLDIDIEPDVDVVVMVYVDGEWIPAEEVINNDDGTITVILEDICPIAIAVPQEYVDVPDQTGDNSGIMIWVMVMIASAAALVVLLVSRRKTAR